MYEFPFVFRDIQSFAKSSPAYRRRRLIVVFCYPRNDEIAGDNEAIVPRR